MKTISRYIMTLALLLTAVTGAWADETPLVTINASSDFTSGSKTFDNKVNIIIEQGEKIAYVTSKGWYKAGSPVSMTIEPVDGVTISKVKLYFSQATPYEITSPYIVKLMNNEVWNNPLTSKLGENGITMIEVYGTAEPPIEVTPVAEPAANTQQWTFTQPGSDVVLTPIYAKAAAFATTGTEPEVKTLLPEAAEGVIAGTTAPLIIEGTVANAGTTENPQGLVMYYAAKGTADAAPTAPTLESQWSADVPTAEAYINDEDGATVYVWYYIAGANTPDGEDPTADNTFNDSEICAKPLKVTLLSNKFDITLKAANANTIDATQASKGTVSVAGTDKTSAIAEGKLQGVKMQSEVKLKANNGYKFRKVEVKKAGPALKTLTINGVTIYYAEGDSWANAISRDENKDSGLFIREGNRVHHPNYGQLVDSNTQAVLPGAIINANESYRFIN